MRRTATVLAFALVLTITSAVAALPCDEAKVRLLLADLAAGAPVAALRGLSGDPSAAEAVARWDMGVRPLAPERFARKLQFGTGWTLLHAGSRVAADGSEVRLSTDGRPLSTGESAVRLRLLALALGAPPPTEAPGGDTALDMARRRHEAGVRVGNLALFALDAAGTPLHKALARPAEGWQIRVSGDPGGACYEEAQVRRILADIGLGGPLDYYRSHAEEPGPGEALRRHEAGVRVLNLARFERNIVEGKGWQVVHKGSHLPVEGPEIELTQ